MGLEDGRYLHMDAETSAGRLVELLPWLGQAVDVLLLPQADRDNAAHPGSHWEVGVSTREDTDRGPKTRGDWRYSPGVWAEVERNLAEMASPAYVTAALRAPEQRTGVLRDQWTGSFTKASIDTFRRDRLGVGISVTVLDRDPEHHVLIEEAMSTLRSALSELDLGATFRS